MKRVYNLYRVSTKGQVDKDDIPMQRIATKEFAESHGWLIVNEVSEKGVSGYKNLAVDRDVLVGVLDDARNGKFDILLVFMLDRLGRKSFDTPSVVMELASYGVEVWSVQEGRISCSSPEDQVNLFLKCWGAEGESRKTAIRVKERFHQLVGQGAWPGGVVPFGYRAVYKGRVNKKNQPIKDLEVDPCEADIVRELFDKTVHEGAGSHMLAAMLNKRGLKTHNGANFQSNTIRRILSNKMYTGYLINKESCSPFLEDLQIVEQDIFDKASEILMQREFANEKKRKVAMTNKGKMLMSGILFCAHCHTRLTSIRYRNAYKKKDNSVRITEEPKYLCYHRSRGLNDCDGAHTYKADIIDSIVINVVTTMLGRIKETPRDVSIEHRFEKQITQMKERRKELEAKSNAKANECERLLAEIGKCLLGESRFTEEMLASQIDRVKSESTALKLELQELIFDIENQKEAKGKLGGYYDQFVSWADEFEKASLERRKMIICELFDRVEVARGYHVDITVNPNYQHFLPDENEGLKAV